MEDKIRQILKECGKLNLEIENINEQQDLYEIGMTSHASVNVMIALENAFDIEFPDHMLRRCTFSSIQSIKNAVSHVILEHSNSGVPF